MVHLVCYFVFSRRGEMVWEEPVMPLDNQCFHTRLINLPRPTGELSFWTGSGRSARVTSEITPNIIAHKKLR